MHDPGGLSLCASMSISSCDRIRISILSSVIGVRISASASTSISIVLALALALALA